MPIEYRSDLLRRTLANLHREAPGVRGSAVITSDGFVIAVFPPGWDSDIQDPTGGENVAAMSAVVVGQAERTMGRLAQGELERVLMEGEKGSVAVFPITDDSALALLIEKDAKMGLTLHAARKAAQELRAILKKEKEE
ncbi:MAG TPA: roadblock/LC7 domain-containing protein [Anaerolineales bacterium]|nr:roadblock/LC7 domain-containing protein [Anaerolineales bacterium]